MARKRQVKRNERGAREALKWLAAIPKQLPKGVRALNFSDLPPELRNAIYELVLRHDEPLRILSSMLDRNQTDDILVAMGAGHSPRVPPASLLRANRQINSEATPIMYGANEFFMGAMEIPAFVSSIGTSTKHLRHVMLQATYMPKLLSSALDSLILCENLTTITLETTGIAKFDVTTNNTKELGYLLLPWATKLNEGREGTDRPRALQVLRIREGVALPNRPSHPIDAAKLEEEVKTYLGKLLGGRKKLRTR